MTYSLLSACRLCGGTDFSTILDLGNQALTGVFPRPDESIPRAPLVLVRCEGGCGLVQLGGNWAVEAMYGDDYGYRSGLNGSMVRHLRAKAGWLQQFRPLEDGDLVVDIGSNDGTSLGFYPKGLRLIGIDPTVAKFGHHYRDDIRRVAGFFSKRVFEDVAGTSAQARLVTSISMFYDLPDPLGFARDVSEILADDGVWHFEQSYLPLMLERNAYDTICHEHLEYYGLAQAIWILDRVGLKVLAIELNDVNGGSFAITAGRADAHVADVAAMLEREDEQLGAAGWARFTGFVTSHRERLPHELERLRHEGLRVCGLGASTKGNVVLQACGITTALLPTIGEVNVDKVGRVTPGTSIPIVSEAAIIASRPDVLLVMPWHFRDHMVKTFASFVSDGGTLMFPLPDIGFVRP